MKTLVANLRKHSDTVDVNIMRPSILGNPFRIGLDGTREEVIAKYEFYARDRLTWDSNFRLAVQGLYGKVLGCCCKPLACHGDVLAKLAEELNPGAQESGG
jgi:hypothetical protein